MRTVPPLASRSARTGFCSIPVPRNRPPMCAHHQRSPFPSPAGRFGKPGAVALEQSALRPGCRPRAPRQSQDLPPSLPQLPERTPGLPPAYCRHGSEPGQERMTRAFASSYCLPTGTSGLDGQTRWPAARRRAPPRTTRGLQQPIPACSRHLGLRNRRAVILQVPVESARSFLAVRLDRAPGRQRAATGAWRARRHRTTP